MPAAPEGRGAARAAAWSVHEALLDQCRRLGGLPIPLCAPTDASAVDAEPEAADHIGHLDALILGGGGDICLRADGSACLLDGYASLPARDQFEYALLQHARHAALPVLGICRGAQLIQRAFGGDLVQETALARAGVSAQTHSDPAAYIEHRHTVEILPGGMLAETHEPATASVNSAHRWCVAELAPGLVAEAIAAHDASVEAFSGGAGGWLLGVLWHPEFACGAEDSVVGARVWQLFGRAIEQSAHGRAGLSSGVPAQAHVVA